MHRIDTSTVYEDKFGAGKDGFTEGDPSTGIPATQISDDWLDAVQEEVVTAVEYTRQSLLTSSADTRDQLTRMIRQMSGLTAACNYTRTTGTLSLVDLNGVATNSAAILNKTVCVGNDIGGDAFIGASYDGGCSWTERNPTVGKAVDLNAVCYGNSLWVAVGDADGTNAYILTSSDATTWTERSPTVDKNVDLYGVCWDSINSLFIAVGADDGGDAYIITSPDGTTWTERTNPKRFALRSVASGGATSGYIVAVGDADGTNAYAIYSTNGTTWAELSNPKNFGLKSVTYSVPDSLWVAVGVNDGTDPYVVTARNSVIASTWVERSNPGALAFWSVAHDGVGMFIACSTNLEFPWCRSFDGMTWVNVPSPEVVTVWTPHYGIVYNSGSGRWVSVGATDGALQNAFYSHSALTTG